jgi:PleD family two-component response regulator
MKEFGDGGMNNLDALRKESDDSHKLILIVDADANYGAALREAIREETPYYALSARNGFQVLKSIGAVNIDLLLLDAQFPDMESVEVSDRLHNTRRREPIPPIFMYGHPSSSPHDDEKDGRKRAEQFPKLENLFYVLQELLV